MPPRLRQRRQRRIDRGGPRRQGLPHRAGYQARDRRHGRRVTSGDKSMTTTVSSSVMSVETEHVLQIYKRNPVVFERGRGCYLFDAAGRGYLDLVSGIGVAALGHAHPRLAAAIAEQAS